MPGQPTEDAEYPDPHYANGQGGTRSKAKPAFAAKAATQSAPPQKSGRADGSADPWPEKKTKARTQAAAQRTGITPCDFPVGIRDTQGFKAERLQTPCQTAPEEGGIYTLPPPIPGERIQMDTCKIALNLYRYTAIDGCAHYRGRSKSTKNALRQDA